MSDSKNDSKMLVEIYREVGETKVSVDNLIERLGQHIDYTQVELQKINKLDQEQNSSLDRHIEGVNTLKELYLNHKKETDERMNLIALQRQDLEARVIKVEKPYDIAKSIGRIIMWVVTAGAALAAIVQWGKM